MGWAGGGEFICARLCCVCVCASYLIFRKKMLGGSGRQVVFAHTSGATEILVWVASFGPKVFREQEICATIPQGQRGFWSHLPECLKDKSFSPLYKVQGTYPLLIFLRYDLQSKLQRTCMEEGVLCSTAVRSLRNWERLHCSHPILFRSTIALRISHSSPSKLHPIIKI